MLAIDNSQRNVLGVPASENDNRIVSINVNQPNPNSRISSLASSIQSLVHRIIQGLREFIATVADSLRNCFAANHSVQLGPINNPAPIELVVLNQNPPAGNENGQPVVEENPPVQNQEQNLANVLPFVEADYEEGASIVSHANNAPDLEVAPTRRSYADALQNRELNLRSHLPFVEADYEDAANAQADDVIQEALPNSDDEFELEEMAIRPPSYADIAKRYSAPVN